jgi:hypothetical protein
MDVKQLTLRQAIQRREIEKLEALHVRFQKYALRFHSIVAGEARADADFEVARRELSLQLHDEEGRFVDWHEGMQFLDIDVFSLVDSSEGYTNAQHVEESAAIANTKFRHVIAGVKDELAQTEIEIRILQGDSTVDGLRSTEAGPGSFFLSHAASDRALASALASSIETTLPGSTVFVASQPGHIRTGAKWLEEIEHKLIQGATYLILLTPESIGRPWMWFETGAVWFLDRRIIPLCGGGLPKSDIPVPLALRQALSLDDHEDVTQLFRDIGAKCDDPKKMVERFRTAAIAHNVTPPVTCDGRLFVWSGALSKLEDWSPVDPPSTFANCFESAGMKVRHEPLETIDLMLAEGWARVYETDGRRWKREVRGPQLPNQRFLVKPRD